MAMMHCPRPTWTTGCFFPWAGKILSNVEDCGTDLPGQRREPILDDQDAVRAHGQTDVAAATLKHINSVRESSGFHLDIANFIHGQNMGQHDNTIVASSRIRCVEAVHIVGLRYNHKRIYVQRLSLST